MPPSLLELRPVVPGDAALVADLDTAIQPDDPRDPLMTAFWWKHPFAGQREHRLISTHEGVAKAFVFAGHGEFDADGRRFGIVRARLHPDSWTAGAYRELVGIAEVWLRDEGARTAMTKIREDQAAELDVVGSIGYREDRRQRVWRLDLVEGRERLLATARRTRAEVERKGVELTTIDRVDIPDKLRQLYDLDVEATEDVPKTVPWPVPTFEEWRKSWFENPAHTPERFWVAREGDAIIGLSVIGFPPQRGIPWTSFTCTARSARGRGLARALKYASVQQAIELGAKLVETHNDAENAPILHLNEEMGYRPAQSFIELMRSL